MSTWLRYKWFLLTTKGTARGAFLQKIWPISCSLGATFGYVAGLIIAPLWIYWNRKQLTYKSR